jgi:TPR repeat protein
MKELWIALIINAALNVHARDVMRCDQLAEMFQIPAGKMLNKTELDYLRRESNDHPEFSALLAMMQLCGVGLPKDQPQGLATLKEYASKGGVLSRALLESIAEGRVDLQSENALVIRKEMEDDADYQFKQGLSSLWGLQNGQNLLATEKWWLKAASQGHEASQLTLGVLYFDLRRYREAATWIELSANAGNSLPQFLLGKMLYFGWGVKQDIEKSLIWSERAANRGNSLAMIWLSEVKRKTASEMVGEQEEVDRAYLVRQASSGGKPELYYLSLVSGDFAARPAFKTYTPVQEHANTTPRDSFREGVTRWYGGLGEHERQDQKRGLTLIRDAADKNFVDAVFWLARAYHQGSGVPVNSVVAYALYFHAESLQSVGAVALADFKPPFETPLNDVQIKKAQQLTRALAEPGRFLQALDIALAAGE